MTTNRQIWLTNNAGGDRLRLPVLPEKLNFNRAGANESVSVAGLGEITIIQDRKAITYEFSSHFPAVYHQGCNYNPISTPDEYRAKIEEWMSGDKPIKFIVTGTHINTFCTIEKFNVYEQGGDPGTLYYTIGLKEFRAVTVRKLDTTPITPPSIPETPEEPAAPEIIKVYGQVTGGKVNFRKGPSTSYKSYGTKKKGNKLELLEKSGNWWKFVEPKGEGGIAWISAKYIKKL